MSASNLNPDDLELPDLPDTISKSNGPMIDSSDEFPLPSFEFDDMAGADILFPEGVEPTAEDRPATSAPKQAPSKPAASKLSLPETPLPDFSSSAFVELPPFPPDEQSLDDDYFQAGLGLEETSKPAVEAPRQVSSQPAAAVAPKPVDKKETSVSVPPPSAPPPPRVNQPAKISLPSVTLEPDDVPDFSNGSSPSQEWTRPGPPQEFKPRVYNESVPPPPSPDQQPGPSSVGQDTMKVNPPSVQLRQPNPSARPPQQAPPQQAPPQQAPPQPVPSQVAQHPKPPAAQDLFFEAKSTPPQRVDTPISAPPPPSEAFFQEPPSAPEIPVKQYVRKVKIKRQDEGEKKKVRAWIPAAGLAILAGTYLASPVFFDKVMATNITSPFLVVSSTPQGEVYAGDELLGDSPLALTADTAARSDLQIRKAGYEPLAIPAVTQKEGESDKIHSFSRALKAKPAKIAWNGLPKGATVWWDGKKIEPSKKTTSAPGVYQLKVKVPDRPAATMKLDVKPGREAAVAAGAQIKSTLDLQPKQSVTFKAPDGASKGKGLAFKVVSTSGDGFSREVKAKSGEAASLILPGPGKYKVSFAGNDDFKAVGKAFEAKLGGNGKLELALVKQPQVVVSAPSAPSQPSTYSQPYYQQPSYSPPPRYYPSGGGGGGGGGGRIAPPAF